MDIDSEHLGIPDTEYACVVRLPSAEFARICKELGYALPAVLLRMGVMR